MNSLFPLLTAMAWAVAVLFFRKSGEFVSPNALNFFKTFLATTLLLITLLILGEPLWRPEELDAILWLLLSGVVGVSVADTLFFRSLNILGAGRSAIIETSYTPFVVLFAFLMHDEKLTLILGLGMTLIVGAVAVTREHEGSEKLPRKLWLEGLILGIIAPGLMALGVVMVKKELEDFPVIWTTTVRLMGGGVGLLLGVALNPTLRREAIKAFIPSRAWRYTIPGSIMGNYVALLLWIAGFKYNDSGIAAALNQTSTLFIVLLAAVFLNEKLTRRRVIAVALAFVGSVIVLS